MKFKTAFELLKKGEKIKRKSWDGYWQWKDNTIMMHCKNGEILDIRQTDDVAFTIGNILNGDWEIATSENCKVLAAETPYVDKLISAATDILKNCVKFPGGKKPGNIEAIKLDLDDGHVIVIDIKEKD